MIIGTGEKEGRYPGRWLPAAIFSAEQFAVVFFAVKQKFNRQFSLYIKGYSFLRAAEQNPVNLQLTPLIEGV